MTSQKNVIFSLRVTQKQVHVFHWSVSLTRQISLM